MRDLKIMYGVHLRVGILSSTVIFILLFLFVPYNEPKPYELKREVITMVEEISAQMEKFKEPPPVEKPKVAIEAEPEIEEAVETIVATEFKEDLIRTMPTGPEIEIVPYYKVEVKPEPVLVPKPQYPELARRAGIEGTTVIKALVDIDGSVMNAKVLKSSGNPQLDEAAIIAARKSKFTPAKQRDKPVRVWVSIPFYFKLTEG